MKYMLDTNILIYLIKNKPPSIAQRINSLPANAQLCMSFFTYAELLKGAERSSKKAEVLKQIDQLTRTVKVEFTADTSLCEHYAEQFPRLKEAGTPIGANDLWIACHALAQQCVLVTNNLGQLELVKALKVERWAIDANI
jgi:tRNA(fMet)-specific endonuclease VapC